MSSSHRLGRVVGRRYPVVGGESEVHRRCAVPRRVRRCRAGRDPVRRARPRSGDRRAPDPGHAVRRGHHRAARQERARARQALRRPRRPDRHAPVPRRASGLRRRLVPQRGQARVVDAHRVDRRGGDDGVRVVDAARGRDDRDLRAREARALHAPRVPPPAKRRPPGTGRSASWQKSPGSSGRRRDPVVVGGVLVGRGRGRGRRARAVGDPRSDGGPEPVLGGRSRSGWTPAATRTCASTGDGWWASTTKSRSATPWWCGRWGSRGTSSPPAPAGRSTPCGSRSSPAPSDGRAHGSRNDAPDP
jgi:hypothetical protein